jgi:hypothetical protein
MAGRIDFDHDSRPEQGRLPHLRWMCDEVAHHAGVNDLIERRPWPVTKLHRWIGFIQACMMFHGLLTVEAEADLVRTLKEAYPE